MMGEQSERWLAVLEAFSLFSSDCKVQFLDLLAERALRITGEDKIALGRAVKHTADRHARFRDADWALPDNELQRLRAIATSLESADSVDQARSLFEDWFPDGASDYAEAEKQIEQQRREAVEKVALSGGTAAVLELAGKVRSLWPVAAAAAEGIDDELFLFQLLDVAGIAAEDFAVELSGALRWRRGEAFDQRFMTVARERGWAASRIAVLLLNWPEVPTTWHLVEKLGDEAKKIFWRRGNHGASRGQGTYSPPL